ncbi:hypothetical protein ACFL5D_02105 [Candidatus Neomarinimicrobiota bacterium]
MFSRNIILILFLSICCGYGQDSTSVNQSQSNYSSILFDSNQSMRSGVESILAIHKGVTKIEDKLLGTSWFDTNNFAGKSGNVIGRFAKYFLVDIPINFSFIHFNHEYYGHGGRYREFDLRKIDYQFNSPPPYGPGGGYAHISRWPENFNIQKKITIWQGGVETHDLLNKNLSLNWISRGESYYNENILYLWTWQDRFQYIQNFDTLPSNINGALYDPEGYIWLLNHNAGVDNPENLIMSLDDLQKKDMLNLINPFVWYSLYAQLKTYIFDGNTTASLPTLKFSEFNYLPSLRTTLTPFGPEYHLENYVKYKNIVSLIDLSIGDQTFYENWWGLGINLNNIYRKNQYSADVYFNAWNQPIIELDNEFSTLEKDEMGYAFSLRSRFDITNQHLQISIIAELGYKTSGFIQGYSIEASPIILLGVGLSN